MDGITPAVADAVYDAKRLSQILHRICKCPVPGRLSPWLKILLSNA